MRVASRHVASCRVVSPSRRVGHKARAPRRAFAGPCHARSIYLSGPGRRYDFPKVSPWKFHHCRWHCTDTVAALSPYQYQSPYAPRASRGTAAAFASTRRAARRQSAAPSARRVRISRHIRCSEKRTSVRVANKTDAMEREEERVRESPNSRPRRTRHLAALGGEKSCRGAHYWSDVRVGRARWAVGTVGHEIGARRSAVQYMFSRARVRTSLGNVRACNLRKRENSDAQCTRGRCC